MGVIAKTKFSEISKSHYLFSTYNYFRLRKLIDAKPYFQQVRLGDFFEIISGFAFSSKDYTDEGVSVCRIGDISKNNELLVDEMLKLPDEYFDVYEKYRILQNDILIGLTGDGKFFKTCLVNIAEPEILLNQRVGILRLKKDIENVSVKFVSLLFNTDEVQNQIRIVAMGKTQKNVSPFDILNIKIPKIDFAAQESLITKIIPIESRLVELNKSKTNFVGIINKVFSEKFGFVWATVEKLQTNKYHTARFLHFANDELKFDYSLKTRFIFNNYIKSIENLNWISLNKVVDVKGGKRLPKGQNVLEDETEFKYVRVEDLNWDGSFDLESIKYIAEKNHLAIKNYIAKKKDILLTIVGATVGKCGLFPDELDGENITENFARLIIKDKESYLPEYVNYCLMSKSSQIQFDEYTGKSSQGKLAIFRIKKVLIPELATAKQVEIVEVIKSQLDKQKVIDRQIEEKQQAINKIIEDAIKQEQS